MPEMTEETYTALLQRISDLEAKVEKNNEDTTNRMDDMTNLFKANMAVKTGSHEPAVNSEARKKELEQILKESIR